MKKDKEWLEEKVREIARRVGDEHLYINIDTMLKLIDQLDEPEVPVVPEFVAENIKRLKKVGVSLSTALSNNVDGHINDFLSYNDTNKEDIKKQELYAKAWLAYPDIEVEKEPLFYIPLSVVSSDGNEFYLAKTSLDVIGIDSSSERYVKDKWNAHYYRFTEQEIKDYDERFWPFAVPVEEVDDAN